MIFRCSKCGKYYNQMKEFKLVKFSAHMSIYYTKCCDTSSIEIVERRLKGGCELK